MVDVLLGSDGDLPVFPVHGRGIDVIAQRVKIRLLTHRGDFALQGAEGMPYGEWVQQVPPDVAGIGALLRREIETTEGVRRVEDWTESFAAGVLRFSGQVYTEEGELEVEVTPIGFGGNQGLGAVRVSAAGGF